MSIEQARGIIEDYLDALDSKFYEMHYIRPYAHHDQMFIEHSYSKMACREILKEFDHSGDLPFFVTPLDILESFSTRMKKAASEHQDKERGFIFVQYKETAEYFIERLRLNDWGIRKG